MYKNYTEMHGQKNIKLYSHILQIYLGITEEIILVQYKTLRPAHAQHQVIYLMRMVIRERETVLHLSADTLCSFCCLSLDSNFPTMLPIFDSLMTRAEPRTEH